MGLFIEIIFLSLVGIIILLNIVLLKVSRRLKSIPNKTELSGFEIARIISDKYSDKDPHIIKKSGKNLDYYDKDRNVIKLTPEVFDGSDMYASITAFNVGMDTNKEESLVYHKFTAFLVLISYIIIILGSFLNNGNIIHFGLIIFVFSFVLELMMINKYKYNKEKLNIEDLIKSYEEYKDYIIILSLINLANLPYRFITFFR